LDQADDGADLEKSALPAESIETTLNRMAKEMSARCPETVWNVIERGPNTNTILRVWTVSRTHQNEQPKPRTK